MRSLFACAIALVSFAIAGCAASPEDANEPTSESTDALQVSGESAIKAPSRAIGGDAKSLKDGLLVNGKLNEKRGLEVPVASIANPVRDSLDPRLPIAQVRPVIAGEQRADIPGHVIIEVPTTEKSGSLEMFDTSPQALAEAK